MKISLLHTSFGRPQKALDAYQLWANRASTPDCIEYILGVDEADTMHPIYTKMFMERVQPIFHSEAYNLGGSKNVIQAINHIASLSTGDLLIFMADDVCPPQGWDVELMSLVQDENMDEPLFIYPDDAMCYAMFCTAMMINRAFYNKFNYFIYPEYDGVFCDRDLHEVAKRLECIIHAPQLLFEHRHYCVGKAEIDATYLRHNNAEGTARNQAVFDARAKRNFDL